jgi:hypothetical protein
MKRPLTFDENEEDDENKIKLDNNSNSNGEQSKRLGELIRSKKKLSMVNLFVYFRI